MRDLEPTKEESRFIAALMRVARKCPQSVWLFAADGNLHVMRKKNGRHAVCDDTAGAGMDQNYIIATINIDADGGDW